MMCDHLASHGARCRRPKGHRGPHRNVPTVPKGGGGHWDEWPNDGLERGALPLQVFLGEGGQALLVSRIEPRLKAAAIAKMEGYACCLHCFSEASETPSWTGVKYACNGCMRSEVVTPNQADAILADYALDTLKRMAGERLAGTVKRPWCTNCNHPKERCVCGMPKHTWSVQQAIRDGAKTIDEAARISGLPVDDIREAWSAVLESTRTETI